MFSQCTDVCFKLVIALVSASTLFLAYILLSKRERLRPFAQGLMLIVPVVLFLFQIAAFARDIPFMDDIDAVLDYLSNPFPERLGHLFDFHNEHRIFTSRIIFETIYVILGRFDFRVCIWIGDAILLGYMLLLGHTFSKRVGLVFFMPFLWLFLDLSNYENTLWAMTSVSNQLVLPLALISFTFFDKRSNAHYFLLSLLFAVLCTYTTGAGIFVWPCLAGIAVKDWLFDDSTKHNQISIRKAMHTLQTPKVLVFLATACLATAFYMHGFFEQSAKIQAELNIPVQNGGNNILTMLNYMLSFCGAVVPVHAVALPLGFIIVSCVVYIFFSIRRVHDNQMLALLCFTLGSVLSGALFRSRFGATQALQLRYGIVSFTLMASTAFLLTRMIPDRLRPHWGIVARVVLLVCMLINLTTLTLGWELLEQRTRQLEIGVGRGPTADAIPTRPEIIIPRKEHKRIKRASEHGVWHP